MLTFIIGTRRKCLSLDEAVMCGAVARLRRPVLMTAAVAF